MINVSETLTFQNAEISWGTNIFGKRMMAKCIENNFNPQNDELCQCINRIDIIRAFGGQFSDKVEKLAAMLKNTRIGG